MVSDNCTVNTSVSCIATLPAEIRYHGTVSKPIEECLSASYREWVVDSGANRNCANTAAGLHKYNRAEGQIKCTGSQKLPVQGVGTSNMYGKVKHVPAMQTQPSLVTKYCLTVNL